MNFKKGDIIIITICMPSASSVAIVSFKDGTSIENHRVCMGVCVYIYIHMGSRSHDKYETRQRNNDLLITTTCTVI
jgi:hypothetical protein